MNGEVFKKYICEHLGATLRPGDIVIMDNFSSHKVEGIREAVKAARATSVASPAIFREVYYMPILYWPLLEP
jgi:hypothetical protein